MTEKKTQGLLSKRITNKEGEMISANELAAVEKFAERLKLDFPIILYPSNFEESLIDMIHERVQVLIDRHVEDIRANWEICVEREAKIHAKS